MTNIETLKTVLTSTPKSELFEKLINPKTQQPINAITLGKWQNDPESVPAWAVNALEAMLSPDECSPVVTASTGGAIAPVHLCGIAGQPMTGLQDDPEWCKLPEWQGKELIVGIPVLDKIEPDTCFSLLALQARHHPKIGFDLAKGNPVGRARNKLATRFLESSAKWLFMLDADMVVPIANRAIYSRWGGSPEGKFGELDMLSRLIAQKKSLIGVSYAGKAMQNHAQYAEAFESQIANTAAHASPRDEVKAVKWVATGGLLIHRTVLEAILAKVANAKPRRPLNQGGVYRFFSMEDDDGEDVEFCRKAREAGIQPYVDLGCACGHIGSHIYWLHTTQAAKSRFH